MSNFIAIFLTFACLAIGYFCIVYKRKSSPNQAITWLNVLPESARNVHLKEINQETGRKFTGAWFLEYWQGQRSAFYAWFTWKLIGELVLAAPFLIFISLHPTTFQSKDYFLLGTLLMGVYTIFSSIILWKCAQNSTRGFKYFARFISILGVVSSVTSLLS